MYRALQEKKADRKRRIRSQITMILILFVLFLLVAQGIKRFQKAQRPEGYDQYPNWLQEMVDSNPETKDFAEGYAERKSYMKQPVDISSEVKNGEVPLFLQWDRRWGYNKYGKTCIARSGCGPTCLSMAYTYLSQKTDMNPRKMAHFASEHGYRTEEGTSWALWTEGAGELGLSGEELSLDEDRMKGALDEGGVIVCSMRPGDFTTTGHFILVRGYDRRGFLVNDPNSKNNSKRHWSFETLQGQIKGIWALYGT